MDGLDGAERKIVTKYWNLVNLWDYVTSERKKKKSKIHDI